MSYQQINLNHLPISEAAKNVDLRTYAELHPDDLEELYDLDIDVIIQIIDGLIPDVTL